MVLKQVAGNDLWVNSCTLSKAASKDGRVRTGPALPDDSMRRNNFTSLRWLMLASEFVCDLPRVHDHSALRIRAMCFILTCSVVDAGSRTTRKLLLHQWIKRFQMASWRNKVLLCCTQKHPPEHENEMLPFFRFYSFFFIFFYSTCKFIFLTNKKSLMKGGKVGEVSRIS